MLNREAKDAWCWTFDGRVLQPKLVVLAKNKYDECVTVFFEEVESIPTLP
jgi:hypothetical protein